ncbi:MAG TPA: hypothetical protein VFO89_02705 [Thermoanaerobaculia bacterium]|nr:hypothetical protein [Thermoanaerobaculia bacterium]
MAALIDQLSLDEVHVPVRVDSFRFVDIEDETWLIAAADYSGRGFYGRLFIIRGSGESRYATIDAWDVRDVGGRVADLDADGRVELIVTNLLTPYGGGYPQATWRAVYALRDGRWRDSSRDFAEWYRAHELPRIEQEWKERSGVAPRTDHDQASVDAAEMERDKVLRVIGGDRETGLSTAIAWASDGRAYRRIYAATILADIATPAAQRHLKELQSDPDPHVAEAARAVRRK